MDMFLSSKMKIWVRVKAEAEKDYQSALKLAGKFRLDLI